MSARKINKWLKLIDKQKLLSHDDVIVLMMTTPKVVIKLEMVFIIETHEFKQLLKLSQATKDA